MLEHRRVIEQRWKLCQFSLEPRLKNFSILEPASIPDFLKPFHLALAADVGNADYQERYLQPLGRHLVVSEVERIVHAVVE